MGGKNQPDYGDMAVAQGEANEQVVRDQTYANRPDQTTPWGYTSWNSESYIDPASGEEVSKWTQNQGLTPELQEQLNKQIALGGAKTDLAGSLTGRMQDEFSNALDYGGFNPLESKPQSQYTLPEGGMEDPYQTRQRAEDAMYSSAMNRLTPQFEAEKQAMEIKLRNQGLSPGDEAYDSQMQGVNQRQTDATNNAIWGSVGEGRAESGQMYGQQLSSNQNAFSQALGSNQQNYNMDMQGANYANQIRQQQIAEAQGQRGQSLNEMNALLSGGQVANPSMPGFSQASAAAPAPIYQAAADQGSVDAASSPWNALIGAAGTGAGIWAGMQ